MTPDVLRAHLVRRLYRACLRGHREAGDHPAYTVYTWGMLLAVYGGLLTQAVALRTSYSGSGQEVASTASLLLIAVLTPILWGLALRWGLGLRVHRSAWSWITTAPVDLATWLQPQRRGVVVTGGLVHALIGAWTGFLLAPVIGVAAVGAALVGATALLAVGVAVSWPPVTEAALRATPTSTLLRRGDRYDTLVGSATMLDGTALAALSQHQRHENAAPTPSICLTGTRLAACASATWLLVRRGARTSLPLLGAAALGAFLLLHLLPAALAWPVVAYLLGVAAAVMGPLATAAVRSPLLATTYGVDVRHLTLVGLAPSAVAALATSVLLGMVVGAPWWSALVVATTSMAVAVTRLEAPDPSNDAASTVNQMGVILPMGLISRVIRGMPSAVVGTLPLVVHGPATLPLLAAVVLAWAWWRLWARLG